MKKNIKIFPANVFLFKQYPYLCKEISKQQKKENTMALQSIRNTAKNVQTIMFTDSVLTLEVEVEAYTQEGTLPHFEPRILGIWDTYRIEYRERTDFTPDRLKEWEDKAIEYAFN